MGIRLPGSSAAGFDSKKVVDELVKAEKIPIDRAKDRREKVVEEKKEFQKLSGFLNELDGTLNDLKTKPDFYKLKLESSHPDIIDGTVDDFALIGNYEFEVRGVAKSEKELAFGFPDKDDTPVGFGFLLIDREDQDEAAEVIIEPGSTLDDVASQINDADVGVRALVINTKYQPDPYRLLVISEQSGKEAKVFIDEDTTFLEFKEQVTGRNLDVLFEDVPITDEDNILDDLLDGVSLDVKRSEPGTRIQVNVTYDVDATVESIKTFVEKYNQIADFINAQFQIDPETNRAGKLAADGSIKSIMRRLQSAIGLPKGNEGKFSILAEVGITTDAKTGRLNMDETKVKSALADDYESVAELFIRSRSGDGVAQRLADRLKAFRDPVSGVVKSRVRGLDRVIENQDRDIERRERLLEKKEESIKRRFGALETQLAQAQSQGQFLSSRFGGQKKS